MDYLTWLGHAAFLLYIDGKYIVVDPWLRDNPKAPIKPEDLEKVDIVLVTHDHHDHLGDAIDICRRTNALLISVYEITCLAEEKGVKKTLGVNVGGVVETESIRIVATPAFHSSLHGTPLGFIIIGSKVSIYHAGDTGFLSDIGQYADMYRIDVALVPIGSVYTMDPLQAAKMVSLIKPKIAIPMHYGTFPAIVRDPREFSEIVMRYSPEVKVKILEPGEKLEL
ncbi:MAG: metal-dependent hydrolase [Thermoprotei archaeon]|nr:MAG: metal-dependent hydrolase [Thermoprotei archaeon]RLE89179.1 MAG: metal-dependent hydrolase [Thermoprotei archaeon]